MSTSLAAQLQKLAVPQTTLLQRDKKRASLLFDPKEAATIDRDTFYEIGISGLRELQDLNADFIVFETSIFSKTSKNMERAVHDKTTNDKLNKTIKRFLMLLSPYFLLKPAHKALEWLINRFLIHEYNQDDFFKLIIPYHETNIFVRCLQLFKIFDVNNVWHWLWPVQKSGVHLNKITLCNHAVSDIGFMQFLSKMIFDAVYENQTKPNSLTTLFAFYCTTTIGIVERCRPLSEPQLSAILPPLLKGLSSNIPDYTASTYMITAQVLSKVKLSHKLLNSLVQRIVSDNQKNLRTEATLLLIVLYQSQADHFTSISSSAMQNIAKSDWFAVNLGSFVSAGSHVLPLLTPVLQYALKHAEYQIYQNLTDAIFTEVRLDDAETDTILRLVLHNCPTNADYDDDDDSEVDSDTENDTMLPTSDKMEWYATLLKKLETQFPCAFDKILTESLSSKTFNKHRQALRTIMNFTVSRGGDGDSRTIFEKLYHPNAEFRLNAVQYLVKNFTKLTEKDREIFEGAVNVLLLDSDLKIVSTIASMPKDQLLNLLRENNFIEMSVKVLINCYKQGSTWNAVVLMLLKIISSEERIMKTTKLLFAILPFLIPSNEEDLELASRILTSKYSNCFTFLLKAKYSFKEGMSLSQFGNNIYDNIVSYNNCTNVDFVNDFKSLPDKQEIHKYLFVLLLATNLRHNKSVLSIEYIQHITQFLPSSRFIAKKNANEVFFFNSVLRINTPLLQGYLKCLEITIDNIDNDKNLQNQFLDLLNSNETIKVLITILSILLKGCQSESNEISSCYSKVMKEFLDKFFPNFKEKINFLANFINFDDSFPFKINAKTQLRIILIIYSLLKQSKQSISWTVDTKTNILVPSLLIGLTNPLKEIREASILVLQLIANCICTLDNTYKLFLQEILSSKEEITLDGNQLPPLLGNIFSLENNKYKHFIQVFFNIICDIKTPVHISASLLTLFSFVNSSEILDQVSKIGVNVLKQTKNDNILLDSPRSSIINNIILRLDENTCRQITINSPFWDFFNNALRHDLINLNLGNGKSTNPTVLALDQISRDVFANLNPDAQKLLLKTLIEIASRSENPEVVQNVYKTIKKVDLDAKLLNEYLNQMKELKSDKILPQRKFRRVSEIPTANILDLIEWKYGITVLEFLQDKKKLSNSNTLLPVLFGILKKCLDFEEQGAVEYPKQLTLSAILHVCNKMAAEGLDLPKTAFNMELIVQCIRASQNPQTHHHALLVLAHTATLIPDQVLHNIMAIFTFMGSSVLRHDDAYSFQIIAKIIDTIIPILVKNCSEEKEKNVASVLRVFVDVVLDVPEHRRMPLFQKLLVTLGTEEYLWLFLVLVFEAHVLHKNIDTSKRESKNRLVEKPKRLDIATNITLQFSPPTILETCIKLLEHVKSLPVDKPENSMDTDCVTFNIQQHSSKQFRHYKYTIVTFLSGLLSSKQLVNLFAQLTKEDLLTLEPIYKNLIISILTYIQSVSKTVDKMSQTPQAQYWKVLIHHCYDTMDSINALLTTEMFLLVIRGLIVHNIPTVRRKAMELLNTKLQYQQSFFYTHPDDGEITNNDDLFALIPSLINIIKKVDPASCGGETEQELIQQTALLSLKLLIKLLANKNPDKFTSILDFIIDLIKNKKTHGNILASVMLCLAELCNKLRAHAIPGLPRYMPAVIKILKLQENQETPGLLLLCIITAIQKIVESLPLFLSPYLEKLLTELTILSAKWNGKQSDPKVETFIKKLDSIQSNIGNVIPSRLVIPIVTSTYNNLLENKQYSAIGPLMNVLAENLANLRGNELNEHLPELTNFFLSSLQFRVDCNSQASLDTITTVEDHIIKTLTALVLKLSETTFRPLYYKLFDWAVRGEVKTEKVITFYRLSSGIAENLKGLFVLFAGHFIKNASELLDATNSMKSANFYFSNDESNHLLIESILTTLKAVFLYDSKNFMDKDRFDTLMQPLVDQLENQTGGIKCLIQRGEDLVVPTIAQFAVAIADDALWKQLNYQVLLKTRHNHAQVRLLGLKCLCEVARKLGEDFLPLLPETIPFLAELLEDEDENVEKSCQKVVQDLEVILGEPLQKYF